MAKMIDQRPNYQGEGKTWDALRSYLPENVIVYTNREINGREFDDCLFIENWGIVIVEVKGWLADQIDVQGVDHIEVQGYDKPQRSPKKQARAYRFALLNRIVEKYNVSPLIFDLVCYPFISEQEYKDTRLDIISEEKFTIFKEDLENQEKLQQKLKAAYDAVKVIPHAEFTHELMVKLRQDWEPDFQEQITNCTRKRRIYSVLSVFSTELEHAKIASIVDDYFAGVKIIAFFGDQDSFKVTADLLQEGFQTRNIEPAGNNLKIGYQTGLKKGKTSVRAFNLELYYVPDLQEITEYDIAVEEGRVSDDTEGILCKLADKTSFNLQQYHVEHAPVQHNTLVEAGAGTGKTFSMVSRVAFLCNKESCAVSNLAEEIAMVTFTNDAANNMRVRLKQMFLNYFVLTGELRFLKFVEQIEQAHISTIHKFSLDLLREKSLYTGLGTNFRISSDEYGRKKIYDAYLSEFIREKEEENPNFARELPVPVYELKNKIIQIADRLLAKSINLSQIAPQDLGTTVENTLPYFNELLLKVVFPAEMQYLEQAHVFNDMDLKECIILLNQVLDKMSGKLDTLKIKYLFIDEFQDTDDVQIQVFQRLQKAMNAECRLFVVGDLKQSIYRFRGARLSAFLKLKEKSLFPWETYHLNINYRTDYRLLNLFDPVFCSMGAMNYLPYSAQNDRLSSNLLTDANEENLMTMVPCHAKNEEIFNETFITILKQQMKEVQNLMLSKNLSQEERTIAILVRSNWQVEHLVNAAQEEGLQIETHSGGDLFQLPSTTDLYKLLSALNNSENPLYLVNLIESNYVQLSLDYQLLKGLGQEELPKKLIQVLDNFFEIRMGKTWRTLVNETYTQPILFVMKQIYDALAPWKQFSKNQQIQMHYMANYEYLLELIIRFFRQSTPSLNQLTEYLKINITTRQQMLSREVGVDEQGIRLLCTTIHKSKGLEYGTVILPYTDEDISDLRKVKLDANYTKDKLSYMVQFENKVKEYNTNYSTDAESLEQISEETRILYVALTRAIRNCVWIKNLDRNPSISWGSLLEE